MLDKVSAEQREIIQSWGVGQAVLAGAGCGKTTTLVWKCFELLQLRPDARIAAVSFTEKSAADLREKISEKVSLENHWVTTIHGLCGQIIREFPVESDTDGEEKILAEDESQNLWEEAMDRLWIGDLPETVAQSLDTLLLRESQNTLALLLSRMRTLKELGVSARNQQMDFQALSVVSDFVVENYTRVKAKLGALDFSDLEQRALQVLKNSEARRQLSSRFDLVLVDEFQDTNAVQAEIISKFVREDLSNCCIVGDPKQSIYRFRDADVSVFNEFRKKFPLQQILTGNFRSRPKVIEFTNQICKPLFEASSLSYEPLHPMREADPRSSHSIIRLNVQTPEDLAKWLKERIGQGEKLEDFALLMRRIRGNEKWIKALNRGDIPFALGSGGLFWQDPRVRELVSLLQWWTNKCNNLAGATFLRAPWVAIPDTLIDEWVFEDPTFVQPFFASPHPLAKRLAKFRNRELSGESFRPGEILLSLLEVDDIEEQIGISVLGLWHRCEELSLQGKDFSSVVFEMKKNIDREKRERMPPPPADKGQVKILTLHGAKGLEFPNVILVDFPERTRASQSPLLYWDKKQGVYLAGRDEAGKRLTKDETEKKWKEQERAKNLEESKRLFYVALTRAREKLVLVTEPAEDRAKKEKERFLIDHWRSWIEDGNFDQTIEAFVPKTQDGEQMGWNFTEKPVKVSEIESPIQTNGRTLLKRSRHSVTEWSLLLKCPRAYQWTLEERGKGESDTSIQELGTRLHSCMERGDQEGLLTLESEFGSEQFRADPVIQWMNQSELMKSADKEVWKELAFEIPIFGEVLVGAMDRIVRCGEGFEIVDFKYTKSSKSAKELIDRYQNQMDLYAWALGRLDRRARGNTSVSLVHISVTQGVEEIKFQPSAWTSEDKPQLLQTLIAHSNRLINGETAEPVLGPHCWTCPHREPCDENRSANNLTL